MSKEMESKDTIKSLARLGANYDNMARDINNIAQDIKDIKGQYVTKEEFSSIKIIVYGMVGMIVVAFFVAVISFFIPHPVTNTSTIIPLPGKSATQ
jgi:hypothetical protein